MQINFTKSQYEQLLKLVYLGVWLTNAHRTDDRIKEFDDLESYVLSMAKEFGLDKFVDDEPMDGRTHFPSRHFEEETEVQRLIAEYDENTFLDELIERLAEMKFANKYSEDEYKRMSREEYLEKFYEIHDEIAQIMEKQGLEAVQIKNS